MPVSEAYDMSQYMRLVQVDGGRVTGMFKVSPPDPEKRPDREVWVTAHDVTIWDADEHRSGRVLYSGDLTCAVRGGVAELSTVRSDKRAEVDDAWEFVKAAVEAAAAVFPFSSPNKPDSTVPA